jgi:TonB family protein
MYCVLLLATASLFAIAAPQLPQEPSSKGEVLELLSDRAPSTVIAELVQRYGISFEPTEEVLNEFRKAGADDVVITAMRTSWHPACPMPLSDKDILVLAEHMPGEQIVNTVQQCGIGFQPTEEYLQRLRSSGAKDELIDGLRTSATKPFSRDNLLQLLAGGGDSGQIGKGVQDRGIDFDPTEEDLGGLRGAGASESLLQAIRDAKRVKPTVNQLPKSMASMSPSPMGASAARARMVARAVCPPSVPSIPVFASRDNVNTIVTHLGCGDRVTILEKDSGRIGFDKIQVAGGTEGFVQDIFLSRSLRAERVTAPVPTYKPEPGYSPKARHKKIEGKVVLWIVVDAQGNVTDARETSKRLGGGLDEKAIETVKTWKFKPATRNGVPVPVRVVVEVAFRLFH